MLVMVQFANRLCACLLPLRGQTMDWVYVNVLPAIAFGRCEGQRRPFVLWHVNKMSCGLTAGSQIGTSSVSGRKHTS